MNHFFVLKTVELIVKKMDVLTADTSATIEVVDFVTSPAKLLLGRDLFVLPQSPGLELEAKQNKGRNVE